MNESLKISILQSDILWENPTANLSNFEEMIAASNISPDLIILPEMFNAGFSMEYAEPMNFTTHKWMKQMAARYQTHVLGSIAIKEKAGKFNRALWINRNGETKFYDKRHLFSLGNEQQHFVRGTQNTICEINNWKLMPQICYDLRFPVWSRNVDLKYDVLVYVASWPKVRTDAWITLLKARALENQCFVIGVNRLGKDGNDLEYNGQSIVVDFKGQVILDAKDKQGMFSTEINMEELQAFRDKFSVFKDSDDFRVL